MCGCVCVCVCMVVVVVVQLLSCVQLLVTSWTSVYLAPLFFTITWSLLKLMSIGLVVLSNHLILCHLLLFLPSIFLSIRISSIESALCIRWPKCWSFSIRTKFYQKFWRTDTVQEASHLSFLCNILRSIWLLSMLLVYLKYMYYADSKTGSTQLWNLTSSSC